MVGCCVGFFVAVNWLYGTETQSGCPFGNGSIGGCSVRVNCIDFSDFLRRDVDDFFCGDGSRVDEVCERSLGYVE